MQSLILNYLTLNDGTVILQDVSNYLHMEIA